MYLTLISAAGFFRWLRRLGGPGLIGIAILDGSPIPVPGSTDVFLIVLTARGREFWPFYALAAIFGAVIGGYLTYSLAEKGEEETLERKIGRKKAKGLYSSFKTHGFATVFLGALLPPPFPTSPVILTAGALQYPRRSFLLALTLGRSVRYFALAFAAHIYGRRLIRILSNYYKPFLYVLIALGVLGGVAALLYFKWYRPSHHPQHPQRA